MKLYRFLILVQAVLWQITINNICYAISVSDRVTSIVTGANGYVGRAIVHEILQSCDDVGQDIVCLVRSHRVAEEKSYWERNNGKGDDRKNIISVFPYDMLDGGVSLEQALLTTSSNQPRRVYHTASVFGPTVNHKKTALENVLGTEDLVRTLAKVGNGNFKLILTSSMAAVRGTGQSPKNGLYYTHADWNAKSELGKNWGESYQWSKAQSEFRALELCMEFNIPMVSLCPSFVFGPPYGDSSSYSIDLVQQWLYGKSPVQSRLFVDIRDCAKAHVIAANIDKAVGQRYILSTEARVSSQTIAGWLQTVCRQSNKTDPSKIHFDSTFTGGAIQIGDKEVEATKRLQDDLGIVLRSVESTIVDMAERLLEADSVITK